MGEPGRSKQRPYYRIRLVETSWNSTRKPGRLCGRTYFYGIGHALFVETQCRISRVGLSGRAEAKRLSDTERPVQRVARTNDLKGDPLRWLSLSAPKGNRFGYPLGPYCPTHEPSGRMCGQPIPEGQETMPAVFFPVVLFRDAAGKLELLLRRNEGSRV